MNAEIHSTEDDARAPAKSDGVHERQLEWAIALPQPNEAVEETKREERQRHRIDGVRAGPTKVSVVENRSVVIWYPNRRGWGSWKAE